MIRDATPPELLSFDLNLNNDRLLLEFSEAVDSSTLNVDQITLQELQNVSVPSIQLQFSSIVDEGLTSIVLQLGGDGATIRSSGFANSKTNTFLSISQSAVSDLSDPPNQLVSILSTDALNVSFFTADDKDPEILSFVLDLNSSSIIIIFSEAVRAATGFNLSNSLLLNQASESALVRFSIGGNVVNVDDRPVTDGVTSLKIILDQPTTTNIKGDNSIGTSVLNTYIFFPSGSFSDIFGQTNSRIIPPIQAIEVLPDVTPATLTNFDLDMNSNTLTLTFDDVIESSSVSSSSITLLN